MVDHGESHPITQQIYLVTAHRSTVSYVLPCTEFNCIALVSSHSRHWSLHINVIYQLVVYFSNQTDNGHENVLKIQIPTTKCQLHLINYISICASSRQASERWRISWIAWKPVPLVRWFLTESNRFTMYWLLGSRGDCHCNLHIYYQQEISNQWRLHTISFPTISFNSQPKTVVLYQKLILSQVITALIVLPDSFPDYTGEQIALPVLRHIFGRTLLFFDLELMAITSESSPMITGIYLPQLGLIICIYNNVLITTIYAYRRFDISYKSNSQHKTNLTYQFHTRSQYL